MLHSTLLLSVAALLVSCARTDLTAQTCAANGCAGAGRGARWSEFVLRCAGL